MKKKTLFTAISIAAVSGHAVKSATSLKVPDANPAELIAYQAAIASGSEAEMQKFLSNYPTSKFVGSVLGEWVQKIQPHTMRQPSFGADVLYAQYGGDNGGDSSDSQINTQQPAPARPRVSEQATSTIEAERTLQQVEKASGRLQGDVSRCGTRVTDKEANDCLGLALSYYATSLSSPKVVLPAQLKPIPKIVARTARAVRTAPTAKRAREIVQEAVAEVRKQIKLLQVADDSAGAKLQVRAGTAVAASLDTVSDKLRQVEL